ncbi:hypothetical protein Tco_1194146 [Tanacetum coccineum]
MIIGSEADHELDANRHWKPNQVAKAIVSIVDEEQNNDNQKRAKSHHPRDSFQSDHEANRNQAAKASGVANGKKWVQLSSNDAVKVYGPFNDWMQRDLTSRPRSKGPCEFMILDFCINPSISWCTWAVLELANRSYMIFAYEHLESFRHMAGQLVLLSL